LVNGTIARSPHAPRWGAILAILIVGAHAAILGTVIRHCPGAASSTG
jgi:hypothetical protein